MKDLTNEQINRVIHSAEFEMKETGELSWTTSKLLIRALKQQSNENIIKRLTIEENRVMHGEDNGGSYMYYTKDGHYISINQINRTLNNSK